MCTEVSVMMVGANKESVLLKLDYNREHMKCGHRERERVLYYIFSTILVTRYTFNSSYMYMYKNILRGGMSHNSQIKFRIMRSLGRELLARVCAAQSCSRIKLSGTRNWPHCESCDNHVVCDWV